MSWPKSSQTLIQQVSDIQFLDHESCLTGNPQRLSWTHDCNSCIKRLLWDVFLPWCLPCFVWIYCILFFFFFSQSLLSSLQLLIKVCAVLLAPTPLQRCFIYSPPGRGSHASVCWEGILISCNFPMLTCAVARCGDSRENTDVNSMEWQMKNRCEIEAPVCCIFV